MEELLQVGVITQTHGIRGEVKVFPTTDDVNRFKKLKETILDTGKEKITLEIEGVKFFKQYAILKFKGFDNINDIVVQDGVVGYFDFADCFAELLDTGNIAEEKDENGCLYRITDQGIHVADKNIVVGDNGAIFVGKAFFAEYSRE